MKVPSGVTGLIRQALEEDIGFGDITSELLLPESGETQAFYIAKGDFVFAGFPFVREVFSILDPSVTVRGLHEEGSKVKIGDVLGEVSGKTRIILAGERVGLNILQRLSGIATLTNLFVEAVRGTGARILDTRKTAPCQRFMDKYAVRMGGGGNHRFGLFDGILIKDNHIAEVGGVRQAVGLARAGQRNHLLKIEVEVKDLNELTEGIEAGADVIMLDNMSLQEMKEAVAIAGGRVMIEASGNVNLGNVREIAETGVDLISIGALTHSAPAADISMKIIKQEPKK